MVPHSLTLIHSDKQAGPTEPGVKGSDTRTHKDSQGHTGTHRDSQGLTGSHRDSQGLTGTHTRTHRDSRHSHSLTLIHTEKEAGPTAPGLKWSDTRTHKDSQGHTGIHRNS